MLKRPRPLRILADVRQLMAVLDYLVDQGNSVVVIEHNLDVIKCADNIIDIGPEGGEHGGVIVSQGTPEQVASDSKSFTGKHLKRILRKRGRRQRGKKS